MNQFTSKKTNLNNEENKHFQEKMTEQMRKYLWLPLCLMLVFQLYNILYTLHYTNFTLRSTASKVYFVLYFFMFIVLLFSGIIFYISPLKHDSELTLHASWLLAAFILLWALCITVYDQRTSDNTALFTQAMLGVAVLFYMPPKIFFPLLLSDQILLLIFLPLFQTGEFGDNYGIYVNSTYNTLIALFICYFHYHISIQNFKSNLIIEEKNLLLIEANQKLGDQAKKDQLTQVYNRYYLSEYLNSLCHTSNQAVQFYMIDIDNFKLYNDYFGHICGDACLRKIASVLQDIFKEGCMFRFGGEEFLGILNSDILDPAFGESICSRIRELDLDSPVPGQCVTISIGASSGTVNNEAAWEKLLKKADIALYTAKKNGKDQIVYD